MNYANIIQWLLSLTYFLLRNIGLSGSEVGGDSAPSDYVCNNGMWRELLNEHAFPALCGIQNLKFLLL